MMTKDEKKKAYVPPIIEVTFVEMEHGIAAGSAQAIPQQSTTTETWDEQDQSGTLDW
ncbi:hypothetical protein [Elizabethkingia miricola]|uniref:hypothetical protein n=1 Tax=Elizabethkingia miricola TaxID=172045 RepID=UPI0015C40FEE|nr:hypothetical protein [Elizabethkingia miricola]